MGHHGMVDLAHFIFNRCQYDPSGPATPLEWKAGHDKRFDVFGSCSVYDGLEVVKVSKGNESMQMDIDEVPVEQDEFMKPFFSGYGNRYADIANVEDLGPDNSYTYLIDPYLQQLLETHHIRCPSYLFDPKLVSGEKLTENSKQTTSRHLTSVATSPSAAQELAAALASCGDEIAQRFPSLPYRERLQQEGLIQCLVVRERSGGVIEDYSSEFRHDFRIPPDVRPYCVDVLEKFDQRRLALLASDSCTSKYGQLTGVNFQSLLSDR
ncbi:hypothetical protein PINS_up023353 [Pythium insidiosum]|nr:hypothetical protein PINS_up023353 [Pythium insidiosum]